MKRLFIFIIGILEVILGCSDSKNNDEKSIHEIDVVPLISLSTTDLIFDAKGGEQEFSILNVGESEWTIENNSSWCRTNLSHGKGDNIVKVTVEKTELYDDRNTNIIVHGKGNSIVLTVTQKKKDALLLTKDKYDLPTTGGNITVEVKSNIMYTTTIPQEFNWIKQVNSKSRALETKNLNFSIEANPDTDKREGFIIFKDNGSELADTVRVYQAQKDELVLVNDKFVIDFKGGELDVELKSNVNYEVDIPIEAVDWVSSIDIRDFRVDKLSFQIEENLSYQERSVDIVIQDKNSQLVDTLCIKQYPKDMKVAHVTKAGTLKDLFMDEELFQIDRLAISGNLNIDDFEIIRDKMSILSYLDLSATSMTSLPDNAFYNPTTKVGRASIKAIVLPNTLTRIGRSCFQQCEGLETIRLPSELKYIGDKAFYGCLSLTSILIPNSVTYMGTGVLGFCRNIRQVTLSNSINELGEATFQYCEKLKNVYIPETVTSIGKSAFAESGVEIVDIPNGVTVISSATFMRCMDLKEIRFPINLLSVGSQAFYGTSLKEIIIPDKVTFIGESAFEACTELASVSLGESVNSIGNYAFYGCSQLKTINLPNSLLSLGQGAFARCSNLTSIQLPRSLVAIKDHTFDQAGLLSITIPGNIASIDEAAFQDCKKLVQVNIKEGVRFIKRTAFINCYDLISINIAESVSSIGDMVFSGCRTLESISLPNGISQVESDMFCGCINLKSIVIPVNVKTIGEGVLSGCENLRTVIMNSIQPPVYNISSDEELLNLKGCTLLVPSEGMENYKSTYPWSQIKDIVENTERDNIKSIGNFDEDKLKSSL